MKLNRKKFDLARARACKGTKELEASGISRGTLCSLMKKRKGTIQAVFDVGYGLYDKKRLADFQNGAECTFMYGYLCALEDQEKQQSVAE